MGSRLYLQYLCLFSGVSLLHSAEMINYLRQLISSTANSSITFFFHLKYNLVHIRLRTRLFCDQFCRLLWSRGTTKDPNKGSEQHGDWSNSKLALSSVPGGYLALHVSI